MQCVGVQTHPPTPSGGGGARGDHFWGSILGFKKNFCRFTPKIDKNHISSGAGYPPSHNPPTHPPPPPWSQNLKTNLCRWTQHRANFLLLALFAVARHKTISRCDLKKRNRDGLTWALAKQRFAMGPSDVASVVHRNKVEKVPPYTHQQLFQESQHTL